MMGWILGFGIPIAYIVIGAFNARRIYRFKVRHDTWKINRYNDDDFFVLWSGVFWPVFAPVYFLGWQTRVAESFGGGLQGWFTKNTPISVEAEKRAQEMKAAQSAARIKELEIECGIREKPTYTTYNRYDDYIA